MDVIVPVVPQHGHLVDGEGLEGGIVVVVVVVVVVLFTR